MATWQNKPWRIETGRVPRDRLPASRRGVDVGPEGDPRGPGRAEAREPRTASGERSTEGGAA